MVLCDGSDGKLIHHLKKKKNVANRKGQIPNGVPYYKTSLFPHWGTDSSIAFYGQIIEFQRTYCSVSKSLPYHEEAFYFLLLGLYLLPCTSHGQYLNMTNKLYLLPCTSHGQYLNLTNKLPTKMAERVPINLKSRPRRPRPPCTPPSTIHPSLTTHSL